MLQTRIYLMLEPKVSRRELKVGEVSYERIMRSRWRRTGTGYQCKSHETVKVTHWIESLIRSDR